jgi:hypothetical protein
VTNRAKPYCLLARCEALAHALGEHARRAPLGEVTAALRLVLQGCAALRAAVEVGGPGGASAAWPAVRPAPAALRRAAEHAAERVYLGLLAGGADAPEDVFLLARGGLRRVLRGLDRLVELTMDTGVGPAVLALTPGIERGGCVA